MPNLARAAGLFWFAAVAVAPLAPAHGQSSPVRLDVRSARTELLEKAHALEVRGWLDLAEQTWQQALLVDPNSTEALAGLARAAKLGGRPEEAQRYLDRLRAIDPTDRSLREVAGLTPPNHGGSSTSPADPVARAWMLMDAGQYSEAKAILRQVYGSTPPAGEAAVLYYRTEGAIPEGRPHAVASLRALVDEFPRDARYKAALGEVLSRDPRTRDEGGRYLDQVRGGAEQQAGGPAGLSKEPQLPGRLAAPPSHPSVAPQRNTGGRRPGMAAAPVKSRPQATPTATVPAAGVAVPVLRADSLEQGERVLQVLGALHARGENAAAVAQVAQLSPEVRRALKQNPVYLRLVAEVYAQLGDARQAAMLLQSAEDAYTKAHLQPPPELELRRASLLLTAGQRPRAIRSADVVWRQGRPVGCAAARRSGALGALGDAAFGGG